MKANKIQNKVPFVIFSILLILVLTSYAFAATYYVDASCGSNGNGTQPVCGTNGPWETLAEAAAGVPSGSNHIISVAPGTYFGFTDSRSGPGSTAEVDSSYRIWKANGTVTITSKVTINGDWVKFDGFHMTTNDRDSAIWNFKESGTLRGTANCWFTNLTIDKVQSAGEIFGTNNLITNWDVTDFWEDCWRVFGTGHTFRGNYVHNFIRPSSAHSDIWQTFDATYNPAAQNITIERNHVFMGSDASGELARENGGSLHLFMWEDSTSRHASGLVIRNNIFESLGGFNSALGRPDGLRVHNNLFRNDDDKVHSYSGPGVIVAKSTGGCDDVVIRNNMFIDGDQGVEYGSGCTNKVNSNNLFWRSDGGSISNVNYSGTGDKVNVNPLFTSYSRPVYNVTSGYKLQSGSPVIDAGTTISSVKNDYDGISRPQGEGYDLGAYEYTSIAMPPAPPRGLKVIP